MAQADWRLDSEAISRINAVADNTKHVARLFASLFVAALQQLVAVTGFYAVAGIASLAMSRFFGGAV